MTVHGGTFLTTVVYLQYSLVVPLWYGDGAYGDERRGGGGGGVGTVEEVCVREGVPNGGRGWWVVGL